MFRKSLSLQKLLAVLVTATFTLLQIQGCGGGGDSGRVTEINPPQQNDTSKPTVNSTTPAHNSVTVGINSAMTVTFNEPIDPATINTQTFLLIKDGVTPVTGNVSLVGATAQFKPAENLSAEASYTATITTGVRDLAANAVSANYSWQFSTDQSPDITPPTVLATFPASNSVGLALNSAISVTFNETIDPATINAQTFIFLKDGTTTPVEGSVTYVGTTAQFRPASNLSAGVLYSSIVTTGVKDLAGNAMATNVSWVFTTGNASDSDTVGPQVLSVSPPDGATNVPVDSAIVVFFNEPILPFEYGLINNRPVAVTFNDAYTTVTLKPTVAWLSGTSYAVLIRAKDMAGNLMPAAFTWRFSTSP